MIWRFLAIVGLIPSIIMASDRIVERGDSNQHGTVLGAAGGVPDDPAGGSKVIPVKNVQKQLPLPGEVFEVEGHTAFVIPPKQAAGKKPMPWVWYAPTLPNLPGELENWMFEQFLAKGIAIAGVDVGESYGSPAGRQIYQALYQEMTARRGMSPKPCLLARSRGGLMLYNWAAEHPESVGAIAGIYPVCNLRSYPGLGKACGAYGLTAPELEAKLSDHNPIERLAPLAKAKVPILHLHGDMDRVVPLNDNSAIVKQRYTALGGQMTLVLIPGGGHDGKPHWFTSQELVDFVIRNARSD